MQLSIIRWEYLNMKSLLKCNLLKAWWWARDCWWGQVRYLLANIGNQVYL